MSLTWAEALRVAEAAATREGHGQTIAEATGAAAGTFVVGPAKGWSPPPEHYVIRARFSDRQGLVTEPGWTQPK